jgi:hypothetical protein
MKKRFVLLGVVFALMTPRVFAEWKVLKDAAGSIVEIVVDFSIENLRINADGSASFKTRAQIDGEEIGFSVSMSKAREGEQAVLYQERNIPIKQVDIAVMHVDIDITSSGTATKNLERRLADQLGLSAGAEGLLRVVGPRRGICPPGAASIAGVANIHAGNVGLTYDDDGKQIAGECLGLELVVDAPVNRITAHFYEVAGAGGTAKKDQARSEWFKLHQKKG